MVFIYSEKVEFYFSPLDFELKIYVLLSHIDMY